MNNIFLILLFFPFFAFAQLQDKQDKNNMSYCGDCDEIKKIKKQQMAERLSSNAYRGKKKNHYLQHVYFRNSRIIKKVFKKHNKKIDYHNSCFVW